MIKLLTLFFCVVLSGMASAASLSPDTTTQCAKPLKVYANSLADGKTAILYAYNSTATDSKVSVSFEVQYHASADTAWKAGGLITYNASNFIPDTLLKLTPCSRYVFRIRTVCSLTQTSDWVLGDFLTAGCPTPCTKIQQLFFSATDTANAVGKWTSGGSGKYYIQYKVAADSVTKWLSDSTTQTTFNLIKLKKCTPYVVRIITFCDNKPDTVTTRFQTFCPPVVCVAPANLKATVSADTTVTFKWTNTLGSTKSVLVVASITGDFKKSFTVSDSSFILTGLPKCQQFNAAVAAQCDSTHYSSPSNYIQFSTGGCVVTCQKILQLSFQGFDTVSAVGGWNPTGANKYFVEYKLATDSVKTWLRDSSSLNSIRLKNLKPCTIYNVRVLSPCNGKFDTSAVTKFQTICPVVPFICNAPKGLTDTIVSDTVVVLKWASSGVNSNYAVSVFFPGSTAKKTYIATTNSITIKDLPKCFGYYAYVQLRCDSTHTSEPSDVVQFATKGCVIVPPTCNKIGLISVSDVTSNNLNVSWNKSGSGKYIVQHKIAVDSIKIWSNDTVSNESFTIKNLAPCTAYSMRVLTNCNGKLDTSSSIRIITLCPRPICVQPYGINVKISADTVANISWRANGAKSFVLQYRELTTTTVSNWSSIFITDSFANLKVKVCSYYQTRLRATCDSLNPNWLYYEFKTTGSCLAPVCAKPSDIQTKFAGNITYVFWYYPTPANATQPLFEVQFKATTDTAWSATIKSTSVYTILTGLVNCKQYAVRVRADCSNTSSSDWATYTFFAGQKCNAAVNPIDLTAATLSNVGVSPNPSTTDPTVAFDLAHTSNVTIKVFNVTGSGLININLGTLSAGTYYQTVNNASSLNAGFYIIATQAEGEAPVTTRWMKL